MFLKSISKACKIQRNISFISKVWSGAKESNSKFVEQQLVNTLKTKFPKASTVCVTDVSGGCGAMFEVVVEAPEFAGLSILKQHVMVNETLKEQIKDMHGIRIHTAVPNHAEKVAMDKK